MRSFNALDVTRRPRNEVKGRYANMWTRSSGGQSNKLVIVAWGKEGQRSRILLTPARFVKMCPLMTQQQKEKRKKKEDGR